MTLREHQPILHAALLILTDSLSGGLGNAVVGELDALRKMGIGARLAAPESSESTSPDFFVPVPGAIKDVRGMRRAARELRQVLNRRRFSAIHAHGVRSAVLAQHVSGDVPVMVTFHGAPPSSRLRRAVLRRISHQSLLAVSVAPIDVPGWTHLWHWSAAARQELNCSDKAHSENRRETGAESDTDKASIVIGWFGRLEHPKRFDKWLEAVSHLHAQESRVRGVVIGSGPLEPAARALAAVSPVPVAFVGTKTPGEAFSVMDIFLTWSDSEGVPFTIQEAIAYGVPAFSNDLLGPRALLGGESGCLMKSPLDPALTSALSPLNRDSIARKQRERLCLLMKSESPESRVARALESI